MHFCTRITNAPTSSTVARSITFLTILTHGLGWDTHLLEHAKDFEKAMDMNCREKSSDSILGKCSGTTTFWIGTVNSDWRDLRLAHSETFFTKYVTALQNLRVLVSTFTVRA